MSLKVVHKQEKVLNRQEAFESKHPLADKVQSDKWSIPLGIQTPKTRKIMFPKWYTFFHKKMIAEFLTYLANNERAIALSSNQMKYKGQMLTSRFFGIKDIENESVYIVLNPVILKYYGKVTEKSEFCMSHVGTHEIVDRYHKIIVEYYTGFGEKVREVKEGKEAQVWQHEVDHLNGHIKDMKPLTQIPHNLKVSRNADCPCGSGKKYKHCCGK